MIVKNTLAEELEGYKGLLTARDVEKMEEMHQFCGFRNIEEYKAIIAIEASTDRIKALEIDIIDHMEWINKNSSRMTESDLSEELETLESNRLALTKQIERKKQAESALKASKEMPEQFGLVRNYI